VNTETTQRESNTWKWVALALGVLFLTTLICVAAGLTGGLFGYLVGRRATATGPHRMPDPPPEMPREWEPMPPDAPSPEDEDTPWLGVAFVMVEEGAEVGIVVPGSPADEAGVRVGDVIAEVEGNKVTEDRPLDRHILRYRPGEEIRLTLLRDGRKERITVRLGSQSERFPGRRENQLPPLTPLLPEQVG
jgi:hypothetical protein